MVSVYCRSRFLKPVSVTLLMILLASISLASVSGVTGVSAEDVEVGQGEAVQNIRFNVSVDGASSYEALELNVSGANSVESSLSISGSSDVSVSGSGVSLVDVNSAFSQDSVLVLNISDENPDGTSHSFGVDVDLRHNTSRLNSEVQSVEYNMSSGASFDLVAFDFVDTTSPDIAVFNRTSSFVEMSVVEIPDEWFNGSVNDSGTLVSNVSLSVEDSSGDTFNGTVFTSDLSSVNVSPRDSGFDSGMENWSYNMSRIPEDGNYSLEVRAYDNVGNREIRQDFFVIDRTPPEINSSVLSVSGDRNSNQVLNTGENLSVMVKVDDANRFEVLAVNLTEFGYTQGTMLEPSNDTLTRKFSIPEGYEIDGFNPFSVAVDEYGNQVNFTFPEGVDIDTDDPRTGYENIGIELVEDINSNGFGNPGDVVRLTWNSTQAGNDSNISLVRVDFSEFGGGFVEARDSDNDSVYNASFEIREGSVEDSVRATVEVTEESGNTNRNTSESLFVDNEVPEVERFDADAKADGEVSMDWAGSVFSKSWSYGDIEDYPLSLEGYGDRVDVGTESGIFTYGPDLENRDVISLPGTATRDLASMENRILAVHRWGDRGSVSMVERNAGDWERKWTTELTETKAHRVSVDKSAGYAYVGAGGAFYYDSDGTPGVFRLNLSTGEPDRTWNFTGFRGQIRGIEFDNVTGDVFFGTSRGDVFRVDPGTQEKVWQVSMTGQVGALNVGPESVYVGHGGNANVDNPKPSALTRLEKSDGSVSTASQAGEWVYSDVTEMVRTVEITDNFVYVGTGAWNDTQSVRKIEKSSLSTEWIHDFKIKGNAAGIHRIGDRIYTAETWYSLDALRSISGSTGEGIVNRTVYLNKGTQRGTSDLSYLSGVAYDYRGNLYVGGKQKKLVKIDSSGNKEWEFNYGDRINDVATGPRGVYIVGNDYGSSGGVVKLDFQGQNVWNKSYGGRIYTIEVSEDGAVYVGGDSYNAPGLVKISQSGYQRWSHSTGGDVYSIGLGPEGSVYAGGSPFSSQTLTEMETTTQPDLIKLDSSGNRKWNYSYGDQVRGIGVDSEGNVYFGGDDYYSNKGLVKINASGHKLWNRSDVVGQVNDIVVGSDAVYVGEGQNGLSALTKIGFSGENILNRGYTDSVEDLAINSNQDLFVAGGDGTVSKIVQERVSIDYRPPGSLWNNLTQLTGSKSFRYSTSVDGEYSFRMNKEDAYGNTGGLSSAVTVTADSKSPLVESAKIIDHDKDGYTDHLNLTFSESVIDSTIDLSNWRVGKKPVEGFDTGKEMNDEKIQLLPGGDGKEGTKGWQITTTENTGVEDSVGNKIQEVSENDVIEEDVADPVIKFEEGLNLVSFPSKVGDYSLDWVLNSTGSENTENITAIWSYSGGEWISYSPDRSQSRNDFSQVHGGPGYILEASTPGKIVVDIDQGGEDSKSPSSINLDPSRWNLVGHFEEAPEKVENISALSNTGSEQVTALNPFRQVQKLRPGKAYWVQTSTSELYTPEASKWR